MNTAERTLAYAGLGAALSIALLAAPLATPGTAYADEAASDTAAATVEASDDAVEPTLVIGREGATVEVPCASEADPEALVAALAEETGWNLALATGIEVDETGQGATIPLAEDSVVYTGSTEGVDAAYAGEDRADLVYTVLNGIAETIWGNTPYATVRFCAPDGGPIEIEEDGFSFYLSNYCSWYESNIVATNEPLPDDSLGTYWPMPIGPAIAGWPTLSVVFMRDGVEPGEGTIAIVDSEGAVVEEIDVADSERVFAFDMTEETLGSFNLKDGTFMTVLLNEPLKPNETYGVRFATGTFVSGDLTTTTDMTEDMSVDRDLRLRHGRDEQRRRARRCRRAVHRGVSARRQCREGRHHPLRPRRLRGFDNRADRKRHGDLHAAKGGQVKLPHLVLPD